jgi:alpha-methylacyl-CoA racemase
MGGTNEPSANGPLSGTVVLSVGHTLPGLYCLASLRDLGAEIVRIERPRPQGQADPYAGVAGDFPTRSLVAGTSEIALDLKHSSGLEAFRRLAKQADVLLEGFRPGAASRLGIDYESLSAAHPALVYAAISGHGQSGPNSDRVGHDVNYLAETGVLALANPMGLVGAAFADGLAGSNAALNIVAALHGRSRTGSGQMIDCAIVDGPLFLMSSELEHYWRTGESRGAGDTHLTGRHPWYGVHTTRDDGAVAVGAVEPSFYSNLCQGLGRPELASRQFADGDRLQAARDDIAASFAASGRDEMVTRLAQHGDTCVSPVLDTAEVANSSLIERVLPDERAQGERLVRSPVRTSPLDLAPERSGRCVLGDFGFTTEEIETLVRDGAIDPGDENEPVPPR